MKFYKAPELHKDEAYPQTRGVHPPQIREHPLLTGSKTIGIVSGENPRFPASINGHDAMKAELDRLGLHYEETNGKYDTPERSFIVHGPTREQVYDLGKRAGQEAVVFSSGHPNHELLYTNGPNDKTHHPAKRSYEFWPNEPPDNYWTRIPGQGFLRLHFDDDRVPSPVRAPEGASVAAPHEELMTRHEVGHALYATLKRVAERNLGQSGMHDSEEPEGSNSVADKEYTIPEALTAMAASLRKKLDEHTDNLVELRKRELGLEKTAPPGWSEETMHKLKREHGTESAFKIAWAAYDKAHGKHPKAEKAERLPPLDTASPKLAEKADAGTYGEMASSETRKDEPSPAMQMSEPATALGKMAKTAAAKKAEYHKNYGKSEHNRHNHKDPGHHEGCPYCEHLERNDHSGKHRELEKNAFAGYGPSSPGLANGPGGQGGGGSGGMQGGSMAYAEKPMAKRSMCKSCGATHLPGKHMSKTTPAQEAGSQGMDNGLVAKTDMQATHAGSTPQTPMSFAEETKAHVNNPFAKPPVVAKSNDATPKGGAAAMQPSNKMAMGEKPEVKVKVKVKVKPGKEPEVKATKKAETVIDENNKADPKKRNKELGPTGTLPDDKAPAIVAKDTHEGGNDIDKAKPNPLGKDEATALVHGLTKPVTGRGVKETSQSLVHGLTKPVLGKAAPAMGAPPPSGKNPAASAPMPKAGSPKVGGAPAPMAKDLAGSAIPPLHPGAKAVKLPGMTAPKENASALVREHVASAGVKPKLPRPLGKAAMTPSLPKPAGAKPLGPGSTIHMTSLVGGMVPGMGGGKLSVGGLPKPASPTAGLTPPPAGARPKAPAAADPFGGGAKKAAVAAPSAAPPAKR